MITESMINQLKLQGFTIDSECLYEGMFTKENTEVSTGIHTPASNTKSDSTSWFYGIQESPIELRNRYIRQEESTRGWDDF